MNPSHNDQFHGIDELGVIDVSVGQIKRDDLAAAWVKTNMQFAPGAAFRSSMFFEQPFAGSAQFQPGAVNDQVQVARSNPRPFGNRQSARPSAQRRMIRDGRVDLQHSHDRANQPFALAQRQSKHRSQCQSRLNGEIGIVRLAARRGSGLRLPTSQRFVGEPNREASTIAKRCVIVTPVRHSMPLTWNVASALGMEFERHDRSSRWQRRSSVPKLLKEPPRSYPCTKVSACAVFFNVISCRSKKRQITDEEKRSPQLAISRSWISNYVMSC